MINTLTFSLDGIAELDADHEQMLRLANHLPNARGYKEVRLVAQEALDLLRMHLRREEGLLEEYSGPGLAEHARQHTEFLDRLSAMAEELTPENAHQAAQEMHQILAQWMQEP